MKLLRLNFKTAAMCTIAALLLFVTSQSTHAGSLSCAVTTSAACTGTVIYRMSGATNAHAELASRSNVNYDGNVVCCNNVIGLGNSCAGTTATALKLSSTTNAHAEQNSQVNYPETACISTPTGGSVSVGYQATDCTGFDTTLGSIESITNSHIGDTTAYTTKICATAAGVPQTLSFSISDNTIGFGSPTAVQTRYATGDTLGNTADSADAHTISIATNASNGYSMTINGTTLTCSTCGGGATITAIGATAVASAVGTEQFGIRLAANSGTGAASAPYNGANWAFDTTAFPDAVATGAGDSVTTVFGVRYVVNTAAVTEFGNYTAALTYVVTALY